MAIWNRWNPPRQAGWLIGLCVCAQATIGSSLAAMEGKTAAVRAVFEGGGKLDLDHAAVEGEWAVLQLAEGGQIAIPSNRLVTLEYLSNTRSPRVEAEPAPSRPLATETPSTAPAPEAPPAGPPGAAATQGGASAFLPLIGEAAARHSLDRNLVAAMVKVESNFNARAVSRAGAQGLLQLMPQTAARLGVSDPFDPRQNLDGGARYFRTLLDRFAGDIVLALAAYNAGEEAVERYGGMPPFRETRAYIDRVLTYFSKGF